MEEACGGAVRGTPRPVLAERRPCRGSRGDSAPLGRSGQLDDLLNLVVDAVENDAGVWCGPGIPSDTAWFARPGCPKRRSQGEGDAADEPRDRKLEWRDPVFAASEPTPRAGHEATLARRQAWTLLPDAFLRLPASSDQQQRLDGAAFVHGAVALRDLVEREAEIEDLAGVDLAFPDEVNQLG
jgi:hypothetical protein